MSIRSIVHAALLVTGLSLAAPALAQGAAASPTSPASPAAAPSAGVAQPTLDDPIASKREYELALQLRCLVCQNQSIAESDAGLAVDLRNQVRQQVAEGKSDREIIDFMTTRYGDFVLYSPPVKSTTLLLWYGPLLLLLAGVIIAWRVVRARKAIPVQAPLSDSDRARAAELLKGKGKLK
jgi:cytochrome c-type biogenesis protein CcmH/NrfF